jgi:hypothetical protein
MAHILLLHILNCCTLHSHTYRNKPSCLVVIVTPAALLHVVYAAAVPCVMSLAPEALLATCLVYTYVMGNHACSCWWQIRLVFDAVVMDRWFDLLRKVHGLHFFFHYFSCFIVVPKKKTPSPF